mmetsp:Transcript_11503/g.15917  ORF Transcript_11503/g.15917 Transcript_11503/m.15917 type:complete len:109 (+) Transcript_11503:79-405(+)
MGALRFLEALCHHSPSLCACDVLVWRGKFSSKEDHPIDPDGVHHVSNSLRAQCTWSGTGDEKLEAALCAPLSCHYIGGNRGDISLACGGLRLPFDELPESKERIFSVP